MHRTVLLDVDGVMANFLDAVLRAVRLQTGSAPVNSDIHEWDFLTHHLTAEQRRHADAVMMDYNFWVELPVIEDAVKAVDSFLAADLNVEFVTAPWKDCDRWAEARHDWVFNQVFDKKVRVVHITADKSQVAGDVFVDDKPENLQDWRGGGYYSKSFIFDQPYNKRFKWPRLYGWTDDSIETVIHAAMR